MTRPSLYPKPARQQFIFFEKWNHVDASYYDVATATMSSPRNSSEVRRSFCVSAGRRAVASTVEFLQRKLPCRNLLNRLYAPQQPGLESGWLCSVCCMGRGALQQIVYRIPISNLDDLKDRVRTCSENLDQQIIDKFIDQWRDRLKAVVWVNGGHTEQLFWLSGLFAAVLCCVAYACFLPLCIEHYCGTVTRRKPGKWSLHISRYK